MEEIMDCGDAGSHADGFREKGNYDEDSVVGNAVSGVLLFADTGGCGWRTDADTN